MIQRLVWGALALLLIESQIALAARTAVVNEATEIREKPDKKSGVIEKVVKGEPVVASNAPIQGFHKIRTRNGIVGWISADVLALGALPNPDEIDAGREKALADSRKKKRDESKGESFRIRGLGGLNFFSVSGVVNNYTLSNGYSYGGEIEVPVSGSFALALRSEKIFKSLALTDSITGKSFQVEVGSLPIMGGLEYTLVSGAVVALHIAAFGGYALQTELKSSNLTDTTSTDAVVALVSSGFTALGKVDFTLKVSRLFSIFAEGGYRYLQSGTMTPPSASGGGMVLVSSFKVNLSGPFVGGGVGFSF